MKSNKVACTGVRKRLIAFALAVLMVVSLLPAFTAFGAAAEGTVSVSQFTDIKGHWAEDAMRLAIQNGLINGRTETKAAPDGAITRAELASIMVRAFGGGKESSLSTFVDVDSNAWYYNELARAVSMGMLQGSDKHLRPNDVVTRQEAATIIARAFGFTGGTSSAYSSFKDAANVESWATESVGILVSKGILKGSNGYLYPKAGMTRAEYATMMASLVSVYCNTAATPAEREITGNVLVSYAGTELSGKTINGDVFVTEGVGSSGLKLNNCIVNGTVYVRAVGPGALTLSNGSTVKTVNLAGIAGSAGVTSDTSSTITSINLTSGSGSTTIAANCTNLTVGTAKTPVLIKGAKVTNLHVTAANADVSIDAGSEVTNMDVMTMATAAKVTSLGTLTNFTCSANRASVTLGGTVEAAAIGGDYSRVTTKSDAKISKLTISGDNCVALLNGTLSGLSFSSATNLDVTFESGFKLDEYVISSDSEMFQGYKDVKIGTIRVTIKTKNFKFGGNADKIVVEDGAEGAKITITGGTTKAIECAAEDASIVVNSGATVDTITVTAPHVTVSGEGKVTKVTATGNGDYLTVSTKGTTVVNDGCTGVKANTSTVPDGESNTTEGSGTGDNEGADDTEDDSNSGKPTYRLTYHANDGSGDTETYNYLAGRELKLADPDKLFTRAGYHALGWALSSGGEKRYDVGETYKMPSYTTSLYAVWEKDTTGDGDTGDGDDNSPDSSSNMFRAEFPSNAYPADLSSDSRYSISQFADSIVLTETGEKQFSVTGTVNIMNSFSDNFGSSGEGYWIPLVLDVNSENMQVEVKDCSKAETKYYFQSDVNTNGIKYKNKLIVFVQVDGEGRDTGEIDGEGNPIKASNFTISVMKDPVASYTPYTVTYDFSNLTFESNPDTIQRISATSGAPMIEVDGSPSETAFATVVGITPRGYNSYALTLSASNVRETPKNGVQGHWVGYYLQAPDGAAKFEYGIGTSGTRETSVTPVTVGAKQWAPIYFDVTDADGVKELSATINGVWVDSEGNTMTPVETFSTSFSSISLDSSIGVAAVESFSAAIPEDDSWISSEYGGKKLSDYIDHGYITTSADSKYIATGYVTVRKVGGKYQVPIDFNVKATTGATLTMRQSGGSAITLTESSDGNFQGHMMLEVPEEQLDQEFVTSFTIAADDKDTQKVQVNLSAQPSSKFLILSSLSLDESFKGKQFSELVSNYSLDGLTIQADFKKVPSWDAFPNTTNAYYMPLKFKVDTELAPKAWYVDVGGIIYQSSEVQDGYLTVVVPVGTYTDGAEEPDISWSVTIQGYSGNQMDSEFVFYESYMFSGTCEGFESEKP